MPRPLPDELLEEVLRRLPPDKPEELVRAALVCRRWCRLVSDPGFRRRFREFHRRPPMLGLLCNDYTYDYGAVDKVRFIPTTAFHLPHTNFRYFWNMRVLDARHGRVLFKNGSRLLAVWNPITDEMRNLPVPRKEVPCTAAVLCCSVAGPCDHLDCHQGPFLVVFVCSQHEETFVYYSSDAASWSEPAVFAQQRYLGDTSITSIDDYYSSEAAAFCDPVCALQRGYCVTDWIGSALVGNTLYFGNAVASTALKYDMELHQVSLILLPSLPQRILRESQLITTDDGQLGLVHIDDSKLNMWSRKDTHEVDAKWERRVIELKTVFPVDVDVTQVSLISSGVGIILMSTWHEAYTIDLKTYKVKKVRKGTAYNSIPYMSFYTPSFERHLRR